MITKTLHIINNTVFLSILISSVTLPDQIKIPGIFQCKYTPINPILMVPIQNETALFEQPCMSSSHKTM